ncbi:MAG: 30S ribosome-binding factor RbfA [Chloroflexi bacterium]|nr:MAG: 30S ribosome-binding factor RbfA [Chloroflexota bacterium]
MSLKQDRMAERIQQILSELFLREVSDPALDGVTITEVRLDAELMYATVYVNALGDESRRDDVMAGLRRASGFLRREVGKRVRLRRTPELHFRWDTTLEQGERLNQLLDTLNISTEEEDLDES